MNQYNGKVLAIAGGRGQKAGSRTLNRATDSPRQPGSTFKILSTYLPALDSSGLTLGSVMDDSAYNYPGTHTKVNNWSGENYKGLTTLREAIYNSMNIVTVKTFAKVTPKVGFDYLKKLGFTTLVESYTDKNGKVYSDIQLPTALGGLTRGVTNLELTAAFASIADKGVYTKPIFYTKIVDHNGKVLINNKPKKTQVMKESTSWLLTNAMEDVVKKGTGARVRFQNINMPVAGKTGTTSNDNDLWFVGYTPYYTAGIWGGYDNNKDQAQTTYHKLVWRTIMEKIHQKEKKISKQFERPNSIVSVKICTKSGKLAVPGLCDQALGGSTVRTEYFAKGTEPTEKCDVHVKASICTESKELATPNCPKNLVKEGVFLNKKETGVTDDTPFLLPSKSCTIHNGQNNPVNQDEPVVPDTIDNTPPVDDSLFNDGTTYEDEPAVNDGTGTDNTNGTNNNSPNNNTNINNSTGN
jgi:penicillin-binding protein 1A